MSTLPPLISDLALILIFAGIMTVIFKKLKQPLVLGYIVAGFIASPHLHFTPSVIDKTSIHTWSEIGVIFLLFALGLEFSVKKLVKVGGTAVISACTIIFCMIWIGIFVGWSFGWSKMDCLYLGGMLAMSSTTIIYKAFDDMGLRQKKFASLVLSILIIEDILAIVLMVLLSTLAVSNNFQGSDMIFSIGKLLFFLILWFVVGIYLIPIILRHSKKFITNETLLIISLALCFGMAVLATKVGFSAAFGAFIMGSILAETIEAEKIEKLVTPVKDLFGAIFFVSVGMMVDPAMIVQYIWPILVITFAILLGQAVFGTGGVLLAGQPLKTSLQCGFSLMQIGEFAFIIASLGVSLKVTSDFLYPIVVSVSVITTFLTPYLIRVASPVYLIVENHLPIKWKWMLDGYTTGATTMNHHNNWKKLIIAIIRIVAVYSVLSIAVIILSLEFVIPFLNAHLASNWANFIGALITILCISPFLRAIVMKKNHSIEFQALWKDSRFNRAPLISTILLRFIISIAFVLFVISNIYQTSTTLLTAIAIILVSIMILSRWLKKQSIFMERMFLKNLRFRESHAEFIGTKNPKYAEHLISRDLHISNYTLPSDSLWVGHTLKDLDLGHKFGVHVISIIRGTRRINIPGATSRLFPEDNLQIIGTDEQLEHFTKNADRVAQVTTDQDIEEREMNLNQILIDSKSQFLGKTIKESGIRDLYKCLIVGVEKEGGILMAPNVDKPFITGDIVWVVGEKKNLIHLIDNR